MVKLKCYSGICKIETIIEVKKRDRKIVSVDLKTQCNILNQFKKNISEVSWMDCLRSFKESIIYKVASETIPHVACPIPCAITKAIEAEVQAALPESVKFEFIN